MILHIFLKRLGGGGGSVIKLYVIFIEPINSLCFDHFNEFELLK